MNDPPHFEADHFAQFNRLLRIYERGGICV